MPEITVAIVAVVAVALLFDFTNGWNDAANAIATVVSTRVLSPLQAILLAAGANFAGALISTRVAKTIGGGMVEPTLVTEPVVLVAMLTAALWVALMTVFGLPISASHSLIGGVIGAAVANAGLAVLKWSGIIPILLAIVLSPVIGLVLAVVSMIGLMWLFRRRPPGTLNRIFGILQIFSAGVFAVSHGTNDAQKVMGVITLALFSGGFLTEIEVPVWVILASGTAMALGTAVGGRRVIQTLGLKLTHLQPIHGFTAETSATITINLASALGIPVSTTHIITGSIMGVGSAKRLTAVRWGVGRKIIWAWILTLPATILTSMALFWLGGRIF